MVNSTILEALARTRSDDGAEWGTELRAYLDAANVSDVERVKGIRAMIENAHELLACTSLDGTAALNAEAVACALDKLLDAADDLGAALEELAEEAV